MRRLYVEDHAAFRAMVIPRFLSSHQITVATTLAEARKCLLNGEFDAILLDYDLPDGKGIELLEDIERCGLTARVVAVSSRDENNAVLLAAGVGTAVSKMKFGKIVAALEALEQQLTETYSTRDREGEAA